MLKLIFFLLLVFIIIYLYKIISVLVRARIDLEKIIKNKAQQKKSQPESSETPKAKTYELGDHDYKIEE